jgi:hypothetical protein
MNHLSVRRRANFFLFFYFLSPHFSGKIKIIAKNFIKKLYFCQNRIIFIVSSNFLLLYKMILVPPVSFYSLSGGGNRVRRSLLCYCTAEQQQPYKAGYFYRRGWAKGKRSFANR